MKSTTLVLRLLVLGLVWAVPGLLRSAEPAYSFKRGVNISHWISQNEGSEIFANPAYFNESDVAWIAAHGFDHIRLPVDVRECLAADGTLDEAKLKPIADTIAWARARGLGLVLDAHFLPGADFNSVGGDKRVYTDAALMEKVAGVWRDLARRFAKEDDGVRFEILNEPVADKNEQLNPFMHRMLAAIRESNPTRIVYVTSNKWSQFSTVPDVVLPDDKYIALTIHNYQPMVFTHQRAPWAGFDRTMPAVTFPGVVPDLTGHVDRPHPEFGKPGDKLTVEQVQAPFEKVAAWVATHRPGLEVYVGEFGVFYPADAASKRNWLGTIVHECEKRGWSWAVWDYKDSFGVRGRDGNGTAVLEGLFPNSGAK